MRLFFGSVALCCAGLLVFGYFGALHPAGDSFAVVRVPLVIGFAVAVSLAGPRAWIRWVSGFAVVLILGPIFAARIMPLSVSDYDYVLYQQNLLFVRQDDAAWLSAVRGAQPEMMSLQEVSGRNLSLLSSLKRDFPTQVYCDFASVGGVAVLSRYPAVQGSAFCAGSDGMAAVQLDTPHGPVWLVSIHLHWPWPFGQVAQVDRLVDALEELNGHVIIGGDFNQVAWSNTVARIAQASGTGLIGPHAPTFHVRGLPVGIDHVFTGPAYAQEVWVAPKLGSDHHGVVAYLTRPNAP